MSGIRSMALVAAAAAAMFVAASTASAVRPQFPAIRFTALAFDDVQNAIETQLALSPEPRVARALEQADAILRKGSRSLREDVNDAARIASKTLAYGVVKESDFISLADFLEPLILGEIEALEEKTDIYENANPGANTKRQRDAIAKGRDLLSQSQTQSLVTKRFSLQRRTLDALLPAYKFDHRAKPPKSCGQGPPAYGEFARGSILALRIDPNFRLAPVFFDANVVGGTTGLNGNGLHDTNINLWYCDGVDLDRLDFRLLGPGPSYAVNDPTSALIGSFNTGKGFESPLRTGSTVTLTSVDYVLGVARGTITFGSNQGSGTVEFRAYLTIF